MVLPPYARGGATGADIVVNPFGRGSGGVGRKVAGDPAGVVAGLPVSHLCHACPAMGVRTTGAYYTCLWNMS